jgi:hypothetical protein
LLVDYDGTLVPIARTPELAVPDADMLALGSQHRHNTFPERFLTTPHAS